MNTTPPLFVQQFGSAGPVIVLLHGLGASGRLWRPVAERLGVPARLLCPDLLGFGRSPRPAAAYSLSDHLTALDAMLDHLDLGPAPVLVGGTSVGAILALEWAAARPQRFSAVALSALPVYRSLADAQATIASLDLLAWATVAHPGLGELICGVMCTTRPLLQKVMPLLTPGVPADIARDFVLHDWVSYANTIRNVLLDHRVQPSVERLAQHGLPVRLLHGAQDRTAPLAPIQELAAWTGWPLTVLPRRGHRVVLDEPEACAAELWRVLHSSAAFAGASGVNDHEHLPGNSAD